MHESIGAILNLLRERRYDEALEEANALEAHCPAAQRPLADAFGVALVLAPERSAQSICALTIRLNGPQPTAVSTGDAALDAVRAIPAAHVLPLLAAIARGAEQRDVAIDYLPAMGLRVDVTPA